MSTNSEQPERADTDRSKTSIGNRNRPTPSPAAPDHNTGDPMMLDAIRLPRPSREQCQALDLCFYCKKPGHRKDDCEERKQANIRWGSQ